jgi:hypothetical protein
MSAFAVLNIQSGLSLIAFALIARWHVVPRLASLSRERALVPLLWVNAFRYAPLTLFAPGQVDPAIPLDAIAAIAYGDLISALLALAALCAIRFRLRGGVALYWLFSIVGIADLIVGTAKAIEVEMYKFYMGWNWYIVVFYVPMLLVSQVIILQLLLRKPRHSALTQKEP